MEYSKAISAEPPQAMHFARVKSVARAIEKLVRAYGQVFPPQHIFFLFCSVIEGVCVCVCVCVCV